jgi:MFS family permease
LSEYSEFKQNVAFFLRKTTARGIIFLKNQLPNSTHTRPAKPPPETRGLSHPPAADRSLRPEESAAAMKISIYDGFFAQTFAILTGGVFLPAFALALGANNLHIGVLAAIPFFANLFQLAGSFFVEKYAVRKKFCIATSGLHRLLWIPAVIFFAFFAPAQKGLLLGILLAFVVLVNIFAALSGVAWLSWMTDIVPEGIRGRYYGLRNSIIGIATILATLAGGWFLDHRHGQLPAFYILFIIASGAGIVSSMFLTRQPEPPKLRPQRRGPFFGLYLEPLAQPNFHRLLRFSVIWQFAFNIASPFFVVYMLTELGMSYSMTATYTVVSAVFDLLGMRVWGHVSDHTGNKPVLTMTAAVATMLPWVWLFTGKNWLSFYLLVPLLHIAGGFFWAGYNLCAANILFRLSPRDRNSVYFGAWAACNGLAACASSLLGGILGRWAAHHQIDLIFFSLAGLKIVFLLTGILRFTAVLFLRPVKEPKGMRTLQAIRILRSVRSWALMMGDHPALQFFVSEDRLQKAQPDRAGEETLWPLFGRRKRREKVHAKTEPLQNPASGSL